MRARLPRSFIGSSNTVDRLAGQAHKPDMATKKAHIYRIPKSHPLVATMKPGQSMNARMKMLDPDEASEGDEGTMPMEEEMAELHKPPMAGKKVDPIQAIKARRAMPK